MRSSALPVNLVFSATVEPLESKYKSDLFCSSCQDVDKLTQKFSLLVIINDFPKELEELEFFVAV